MARPTGLSDKEVGELWRVANRNLNNGFLAIWPKAAIDLIRKLVEERAKQKYLDHGKNLPWDDVRTSYRWNALNDFGIDPKEYNGTNG